jgi:ferrochelatase
MKDAVSEAKARGFSNLIAIATSAYSSFSSCRQYREDYAAALDATGLEGELRIDKVRQFFDHPGFVMPFVKAVHDGLDQLRERMPDLDVTTEVEVLFSTHSIPMADAERSGPHERHDDGTVVDVHDFGPGGAYEAQHLAVAEVVMAAATTEDVPWQLVYQSRSGPPTQPWLEPDINDAIAELPARGIRAVVIVPLGFVSDHMEVLWDLDNEALESCAEHGLVALRVATPGTDPVYVSGLVDLVLERVNGTPTEDRPSLTALGPWYDVCRPGCCENVRAGFKPALAGVAP